MALQIGNAACVLGIVSDRIAFEELHYIWSFLLLPVDWDSDWYGVSTFRRRPRVYVFFPQHDDTHDT